MKAASEDTIQKALVEHVCWRVYPDVFWCAIPNGGHRSIKTAITLKETGTRAGVPDLLFIRNGRPCFLELKRDRGGRVSPAQKAIHHELKSAGAVVEVAKGLDDALRILLRWGIIKEVKCRA